MNIFLTDPCPQVCAENLDDRRVVKMVLETAQLLSTACHVLHADDARLYKPTHVNHPCALFARESGGNFRWLVAHGVCLANEYAHRFGRCHASLDVIYVAARIGRCLSEDDAVSFSFNCSGHDTGNLFTDYRLCLTGKWLASTPKWTRRSRPQWFGEA